MKTERQEQLRDNGIDWYSVRLTDGSYVVKHATMLSSILQCGHAGEPYGIASNQYGDPDVVRCGMHYTDEDR